jgi:biopolymer transport protein ExbB
MKDLSMKLVFSVILTLFLVGNSSASDRRREELQRQEEISKARQQVIFYQKQLEKVRVQRWQDKRNSVSKKEAFQEAWEELKRDVDKLQLNHTQKEESLMRLQGQVEARQAEVEEQKLRRREFGIQMVEKLTEFEREVRSGFPVLRDDLRQQASTIKSFLEGLEYRPAPGVFQNIFSQWDRLLELGGSRELQRTRFPVMGVSQLKDNMPEQAGTRMVAGYKIRLGTVYQAFISTESPDAAILAKTGKLEEKAWTWLEDLTAENRESLLAAGKKIAAGKEAALYIPVDVQLRKSTGAGFTSGEQQSWFEAMLEEMKGAGFAIYLLAVICFLALLVSSEKIVVFYTRGRNGKRFANKVFAELDQGRYQKALSMCRKAKGVVPLIMGSILKNKRRGKAVCEEKAYEILLAEGALLEKRIGTINILAAAAPLVGLLGTVSGMVNLFGAITMHGTNDPKVMAAGIGESLLSTKWGLLVAIPMLLLYNWMSNRSSQIVSDMEKYSAKTLNSLYGPEEENEGESEEKSDSQKVQKDIAGEDSIKGAVSPA